MISKVMKYIYVILGFFWITYIIYLRLILERLPVELAKNLSLVKLVIYLSLSVLFICLFINCIYKVFVNKEKVNLLSKFLGYFHVFLRRSLSEFYEFLKGILANYFDLYQWHKSLGIWLVKLVKSNNKILFLLLLLDVLPKLLLVLSLFIDVFYFEKFCYFYKLSIFFICPLILLFLEYTFEKFCFENIDYINYPLYIKDKKTNNFIGSNELFIVYCENNFKLDLNNYEFGLQNFFMENHKHLEYSVENTTNANREALIEIYFPMRALFLKITIFKMDYNKYLNVFLYGLYAIIWSYVFFYGI